MRWIVGLVAGTYLVLIVLLNIPAVQRRFAAYTAAQLSSQLKTEVRIGNINPGLLNRIIIDDLLIRDRHRKDMLKATRLAAKFQIWPLFHGKIIIDHVQLFGFHINLYRRSAEEEPNYRFLQDVFASNDTTQSRLDLRINSILISRGSLRHDLYYRPFTPHRFNPAHLQLSELSFSASLKALSNDTVNFRIKKLCFKEQSGLELQKMKLKFNATPRYAELSELELALPNTSIKLDSLTAHYDGLPSSASRTAWLQSLRYTGLLEPSHITLSDLSCFAPALKHFDAPLYLRARFNGSPRLTAVEDLHVCSRDRDIDLNASAKIDFLSDKQNGISLTTQIRDFTLKTSVQEFLTRNLTGRPGRMYEQLKRLGDIRYRGTATYGKHLITADGEWQTSAGTLTATGSLTDYNVLEAHIRGDAFRPGKLSAPAREKNLPESLSFNLDFSGKLKENGHPNLQVYGKIKELTYRKYRYQNIHLDLAYRHQGFRGMLRWDDPNGRIRIEGEVNPASPQPFAKVTAHVSTLNPHALHLTAAYPNTRFSGVVQTDLYGKSAETASGNIRLSDFRMQTAEGEYHLNDIRLESAPEAESKHLRLYSDFFTAEIDGSFHYHTLAATGKNLLQRHLPSLFPDDLPPVPTTDSLHFSLRILNAEPLQKIGAIPLYIPEPGYIRGCLNGRTGECSLTGSIPELEYDNERLSDIRLSGKSHFGKAQADLTFLRLMSKKQVLFGLSASAENDRLNTDVSWDNRQPVKHTGILSTTTQFFKNDPPYLKAVTRINPTQVIINDTVWNVHPATVCLHHGSIAIDSFFVSQSDRHLGINGTLTRDATDSLVVDLKDINLQYVFNIINFHAVEFGGEATGRVYARQLFKAPEMDAHLHVQNFTFNDGYMGNMNVYGKWDKEKKAIFLRAQMNDPAEHHTTLVDGTIAPGQGPDRGLDLNIRTERINLYFLNKFTSGIFTDFKGRASGWARVFGPFKQINVEGDLKVEEARMKVDVLNADYHLTGDSVILRPDNIWIQKARAYDNEGNPERNDHYAVVDGWMHHEHFSNMQYRFDIEAHNVLGYDRRTFGDEVFHGTVYASGRVRLNGRPGELNVDIDAHPERHTVFVYNASSPETITDNQFIRFRTASSATEENTPYAENKNMPLPLPEEENTTDMRINFVLDITPDATMKILMDAKAGDYIALNGYGKMRASYYNKGRFQMYGTYRVSDGMYKLSVQDVIRKDFKFRPGGTLTFGGEPYQADLNLQAVYTVPSVSLNDLSSRATFSQSNVRVNCIMNLGGKAQSPQISFDFDIPNVNEDEKQMVRSLISTEEEKNMQIIYLLGIGRFYTYDYNNTEQSQSSLAMKSLLSSTLSGQLNQALSTLIGNSNWNFGTNLSTGDTGWSDMDVEGLLSGRLLNNRLLINGNFGYRDNPAAASNFVGDFDLQWLLTKNGNISLKAYSETNDRYFTKSALTTQGIGLLFKKDFNNWRELFRRKHRRTAAPADTTQSADR